MRTISLEDLVSKLNGGGWNTAFGRLSKQARPMVTNAKIVDEVLTICNGEYTVASMKTGGLRVDFDERSKAQISIEGPFDSKEKKGGGFQMVSRFGTQLSLFNKAANAEYERQCEEKQRLGRQKSDAHNAAVKERAAEARRLAREAANVKDPSKIQFVVMIWDWKEQINLAALDKALALVFNGKARPVVTDIRDDDDCGVIISSAPITEKQIKRAPKMQWASDDGKDSTDAELQLLFVCDED